jgi:hypothetical protein
MGQVNLENIEEVFTYHAPNAEQIEKFAKVKEAGVAFARAILESCPPCADTSAALRQVRDARMTANAAIALNGLI